MVSWAGGRLPRGKLIWWELTLWELYLRELFLWECTIVSTYLLIHTIISITQGCKCCSVWGDYKRGCLGSFCWSNSACSQALAMLEWLSTLLISSQARWISHSPSQVIRISLDKRSWTSGKQHFLLPSSVEEKATCIDWRKKTACWATVPWQTIPEEFFTYFTQGIG